MRYLDWDVLLFPGHQNSSHVPLKEFKTACFAEHYENAANMTPLLTTFVPTLPAGKPFQISLHSWSDTGPMLTLSNNISEAARPKELWQVRVVIDGICVCTETFDIDATWPQIVCTFLTVLQACSFTDNVSFICKQGGRRSGGSTEISTISSRHHVTGILGGV